MICEHLHGLEKALQEKGVVEIYRGMAWTENCREWVYFDVVLDIKKICQGFALSPCVRVHENLDPKSGMERGLVCAECHDAIMGKLEGAVHFPGQPNPGGVQH